MPTATSTPFLAIMYWKLLDEFPRVPREVQEPVSPDGEVQTRGEPVPFCWITAKTDPFHVSVFEYHAYTPPGGTCDTQDWPLSHDFIQFPVSVHPTKCAPSQMIFVIQ